MKKLRIGVINWDASLPNDTYFGFYQIRSLSQRKYRTWVPFYANLLDEDRIDYPVRTVAEYEQELRYAIDAGIDYFAFVWYPTEGSLLHTPKSPNDCSHKVHELNYARRLYEQSSLTEKIGMCALLGAHPFTENDLGELVETFTKPYYETVDGRPLLYVNGKYKEELITRIHAMCRAREIPIPFTVPLYEGHHTIPREMPLADALTAYAARNEADITQYAQLCEIAIESDKKRLASGMPIIPLFSVGWDPSPRIDRTTPWTTNAKGETNYALVQYAPRATEEELIDGAKLFADHIKHRVRKQFVGHILTFAWNEFEEGGYLCPTYTQSGTVNTDQIRAFFKVTQIFRAELEEQ